MKYFVFCGTNWDWYFSRKNKDKDLEIFNNVVITTEYNKERHIDSDYDNGEFHLQYFYPEYVPSKLNIRFEWHPNARLCYKTKRRFPIDKIQIDSSRFSFNNPIFQETIDKIVNNFDLDFWYPIILDKENFLRDGQHRLAACKILGIKFIDATIQLHA